MALLGPVLLNAAPQVPHPNVLFLFSDDQRRDTLGVFGNPLVHTPHLDRLARAGVSFSQAYVMGGFQGAVCVPSRAMLLTSRSLFRAREDLKGQRTWPEQFAQAGYRTFITGKWHNGAASLTRVFQEGRNVFLGGMSAATQMPVRDFHSGQLGRERVSPVHHTELFAETAIQFLKEHTNGQPFLCYAAFKVPHDPRTATPAWHAFYDRRERPPLPRNALPTHPFNNGEMTIRDERLLPWPRPEDAVRQAWADYYACISHLDEQIGRILNTVRQRGWETNTLVVFAGDNGLALGSHGLLGKQNLYEHSVGVPLIFAGPGVPSARGSPARCYLQDVFPTVAELAGVPPLPEIDGLSLAGIFRDPNLQPRETIFTAYRHLQRAVRDDRWKLIRYPLINKTQLFDLEQDPDETQDLGESAEHQAICERMLAKLRTEQSRFGDSLPLTVATPEPPNWQPPNQ
jgi:arylsulfatase A-like enzyme